MEETIKMQIKNEQGKLIVKDIPKDLSSFYINIGWKVATEKKEEVASEKPNKIERPKK